MNRKRMENEWSIFSELKFNFFQVMSQNIKEVLNREFIMKLSQLVCMTASILLFFYNLKAIKYLLSLYHLIMDILLWKLHLYVTECALKTSNRR